MAQEHKNKNTSKKTEHQEDEQPQGAKNEELEKSTEESLESIEEALAEVDEDMLDEIDDILEENAEQFVQDYVQRGGE